MRPTRQIPRGTSVDSAPAVTAGRRAVGWLAGGFAGLAAVFGLLIAPSDGVQGQAQRLMYLHVPSAWTAFLAFAVVLAASVGYLIKRDLRWDRYAQAAAEIGACLTGLAIAVGSVWGHAVWGVWWAWDPRLVSTAVLLTVYIGYLVLRHATTDPHRNAHRAAIVGIAGFGLVPVVHFSVVWWRSLHQQATLLAPQPDPPIHPLMLCALILALAAVTAGALWAFLRRLEAWVPDEPARPTPGPMNEPTNEPTNEPADEPADGKTEPAREMMLASTAGAPR